MTNEELKLAEVQRELGERMNELQEAALGMKNAEERAAKAEWERDGYRDVAEGYRNVIVPNLRARAARLEEVLRGTQTHGSLVDPCWCGGVRYAPRVHQEMCEKRRTILTEKS